MRSRILQRIIIIMTFIVIIESVYLVGFYTSNKISYSNTDTEIAEGNSESDFDSEFQILDHDCDLTKEKDCAIIIEGRESTNSQSKVENDFSNVNDEQIILSEREINCIDYIKLVDSYEDGDWYCYYLYADGDCYIATIKNSRVDIFVQLN